MAEALRLPEILNGSCNLDVVKVFPRRHEAIRKRTLGPEPSAFARRRPFIDRAEKSLRGRRQFSDGALEVRILSPKKANMEVQRQFSDGALEVSSHPNCIPKLRRQNSALCDRIAPLALSRASLTSDLGRPQFCLQTPTDGAELSPLTIVGIGTPASSDTGARHRHSAPELSLLTQSAKRTVSGHRCELPCKAFVGELEEWSVTSMASAPISLKLANVKETSFRAKPLSMTDVPLRGCLRRSGSPPRSALARRVSWASPSKCVTVRPITPHFCDGDDSPRFFPKDCEELPDSEADTTEVCEEDVLHAALVALSPSSNDVEELGSAEEVLDDTDQAWEIHDWDDGHTREGGDFNLGWSPQQKSPTVMRSGSDLGATWRRPTRPKRFLGNVPLAGEAFGGLA